MNNWKVIFATVVIFGTGVITGGLLVNYVQHLQRLDEELHLAADQHEAILKLIDEGQNQIRKVIQDSRLEIREVLTPEQQKQFDELIKRPFRKPLFNTNGPAAVPPASNVLLTNAPSI